MTQQKITPFIWFKDQAEPAMRFYVSIFKNSKMGEVSRHGKKIFSAGFTIEGQELIAFNGGPHFKITPAISFFVDCKTQKEVDRLWNKLSKGGKKMRCGWLTDKFGVSWQIIPTLLGELMGDRNPAKAGRVMEAMMKMQKIDIEGLKKAYRGR